MSFYTPNIQLLHRHEIDTARWDHVIEQSPEARIYATSAFLDCMAPGWMALVEEDYKAVMPLPVRKKFGIRYVFQPAFCQQLGVFTKTTLVKSVNDAFLAALRKHFSYAEINGHSNYPGSKFDFKERKNYLLPLNHQWEVLEKAFSRSAHRNIQKAEELEVSVVKHPNADELLALHIERYGYSLASPEDYAGIKKFFDECIRNKTGHFYYAKDADGYTIASSGYVQYGNRMIFLMNGNLQRGLDCGAAHLLKARVIRFLAGSNLIMDFEGSDTASFARFYEQYGAKPSDNYPFYVINRLPIPLRWIKQRKLKKQLQEKTKEQ